MFRAARGRKELAAAYANSLAASRLIRTLSVPIDPDALVGGPAGLAPSGDGHEPRLVPKAPWRPLCPPMPPSRTSQAAPLPARLPPGGSAT
jgi:hypothetical protein